MTPTSLTRRRSGAHRPRPPAIRRIAMLGVAALVALLAVGLAGCLSIKSQGLTQPRVAGVVTIGGVVCGSDYNGSSYQDCAPGNIAERDNRAQRGCDADGSEEDGSACPGLAGTGQLLVGFRVPLGSDGPDIFVTDVRDLHLEKSPTYTAQLQATFPAPAGAHWVGYVSDVRTFASGPDADNPTGIHPEFTLPAQADGGPFPGPFRWRWVAGFRKLTAAQAGDRVSCGDFTTVCVDSPPQGQVTRDLPPSDVSDFGVLGADAASTGQDTTATFDFPVRYTDRRGLGAQDLALTASTTVPGAGATPSVTTLRAAPNTTTTVGVRVRVPVATPLGSYSVTLTAADGSPAVTRSNKATLAVVDAVAPSIRVSTPADGTLFVHGQLVKADYACADQVNASGLKRCAGPVAPGAMIDTSTLGKKTFRVDAADNAGNTADVTRTYTVAPSPPPRVGLTFLFSAGARTKFTQLAVKRVPAGSTVTATCLAKRKVKCPVKTFKKTGARGTVNIASFTKKRFRPGMRIDVRVTKAGTTGAVRLLTIRKSKAPTSTAACLLPGAVKPTKC